MCSSDLAKYKGVVFEFELAAAKHAVGAYLFEAHGASPDLLPINKKGSLCMTPLLVASLAGADFKPGLFVGKSCFRPCVWTAQ